MFQLNYKLLVTLVLTLTAASLLSDNVNATPVAGKTDVSTNTTESNALNSKEVDDLNKTVKNDAKALNNENPFEHKDEDSNSVVNLKDAHNMKYDVEVLEEVKEVKKQNIELEERFKGPALKVNTDTFVEEDIEVFANKAEKKKSKEDHVFLSLAILALALVSIGFYAVMVIWRLHLEQRYGMRELLVDNDENYRIDTETTASTATINNSRPMA